MDASAQVKVELWKYNPYILSGKDAVDPLSLALSLKDGSDESLDFRATKDIDLVLIVEAVTLEFGKYF